MKVLHSRDFIAAGKFVAPVILPLRTIRNPHNACRIRFERSPRNRFRAAKIQRQHLPVQRNLHSVVHRLFRRQRQSNCESLFLPGRIPESVIPSKPRSIRAEPQQPFLTVIDRKSTRLNSSHANISYAVFCLKKKKKSRSNTKSVRNTSDA